MSEITLYHGSSKIVSAPQPLGSKFYNDLGAAFYCVKDFELAGRMAVRRGVSGYINKYVFDTKGMTILDFTSDKFGLLSWLDAVMECRRFRVIDPNFIRIKDYLDLNFRPNLPGSDVAVCPSCDDSYLAVVRSFLKNEISYDSFRKLMSTDKAMQYVLLSEKSLSALSFDSSVPADSTVYFPHRKREDMDLRNRLKAEIDSKTDGTKIMDIVRERMGKDDEHL